MISANNLSTMVAAGNPSPLLRLSRNIVVTVCNLMYVLGISLFLFSLLGWLLLEA